MRNPPFLLPHVLMPEWLLDKVPSECLFHEKLQEHPQSQAIKGSLRAENDSNAPPRSQRHTVFVFNIIIILCYPDKIENGDVYQRRRGLHVGSSDGHETGSKQQEAAGQTGSSWRRILLLILAITIHNIPGEPEPQETRSPFLLLLLIICVLLCCDAKTHLSRELHQRKQTARGHSLINSLCCALYLVFPTTKTTIIYW